MSTSNQHEVGGTKFTLLIEPPKKTKQQQQKYIYMKQQF